jgi:dienelactone hydrolase
MNPTQTPVSPVAHVQFELAASDGETLYCDARHPAAASGPLPVVIFVHGFKGFKDWGSIPYICESIVRGGFYVLSFNFSHNGVEGHSSEFTELDAFARNTFSREVRELREVIDAVSSGRVPDAEWADPAKIALVGHSRGGGIMLLEAARDHRVGAVAAWASVADFNRYSEAQKQRWRESGSFETKNMRTGQIMRLDIGLLEDLERNGAELDIPSAVAALDRPLLILHGEQDLSVRIENGEALAALGAPHLREFVRIPRTNHTFGAVHPFEGTNPVLEEALARTIEFFRQHLADRS